MKADTNGDGVLQLEEFIPMMVALVSNKDAEGDCVVLGLTGQISCGKSTVSRVLQQLGAEVKGTHTHTYAQKESVSMIWTHTRTHTQRKNQCR